LYTKDGEKKVLGLFAKIIDIGLSRKGALLLTKGLSPELANPATELSSLLRRRPQYWTTIEDDAMRWAKDPRTRPIAVTALVEFLVRDGEDLMTRNVT